MNVVMRKIVAFAGVKSRCATLFLRQATGFNQVYESFRPKCAALRPTENNRERKREGGACRDVKYFIVGKTSRCAAG